MKHLFTGRPLGKLIFEVEFQQIEQIDITLENLECKLDGKWDL
jgi:hypothetical protein